MDRFIGKRLDGRYEINALVGAGGMASVYKAYDIIDERVVAIKILKEEFVANDEFRRRFKNESKAIAVLSHPNIVKVFDVSFGDVLQYIVMEYCDGITLKEYLQQKNVINWEEAAFFTVQVLKALEHAHEKGIVHRDIKPQNIILLKDGTIKVTDFGIARFSRSEQRTITDKAIGSVHYISPEQARGDNTDGKSDIYSVGVMLYEMTTGKLPFQADSAVSVAIMQLQNEPEKPTEINNTIPKGLEQIILLAMQKEPYDRYPTAFDMLRDIEEIRRNPYITFEHNYRINYNNSTNYKQGNDVDYAVKNSGNSSHQNSDIDMPKKHSTIKVLAIIAAIFVLSVGGLIFYFLNHKAPTTKCPNFVGMTQEEIQNKYQGKFTFKFLTEDASLRPDGLKENEVYKQEPDANTEIKSTYEIKLYYNKIEKIKIDDYTKQSYEDVKEALEELGLKVEKVSKNDDDITENCVIKTSPKAGEAVNKGGKVKVYVSLGPEKFQDTVPDVTGLYYKNAITTLTGKGFKVDYDSWRYDDNVAYGYVISQSPTANSNAVSGENGDTVKIYVSQGPYPTAAPTTTVAPATENNVANEAENSEE